MALENKALCLVLNNVRSDGWMMRNLFNKKGLFAKSRVGPFPQEKPLEVIDAKK
jgi:hypothetical protein